MAGLTRRGGKGPWYVVWRDPETGNVCRESTGTQDRDEAEQKQKEKEFDLALGKKDPTAKWRRVPLETQLTEYRDALLADGVTTQHAENVFVAARRVFGIAGIKYPPQLNVNKIKVAVSKIQIVSKAKNGRGLPPKPASIRTRNFAIQSTKQFLRWLMLDKRIGEFPLEKLVKSDDRLDKRHARRSFTDGEFRLLVETAKKSRRTIQGVNGRDRADIYTLARLTGLRRAEIGALTPSSFHLTKRDPYIFLDATATKNGEEATIPLHADLLPIIVRRIKGLGLLSPLFPGLAKRQTAKMVRLDAKRAGIPYRDEQGRVADFHALRHSYISSLWRCGATPEVVQALARHSTISLTMRYTHAEDAAKVAAVRAMPGLSAKPAKPRRRAK